MTIKPLDPPLRAPRAAAEPVAAPPATGYSAYVLEAIAASRRRPALAPAPAAPAPAAAPLYPLTGAMALAIGVIPPTGS